MKAARAGVEAIKALEAYLIEPVPIGFRLRTIERRINEQLASDIDLLYPIKRKDETSRERVLAYDLYKNNLQSLNKKGTAIICQLMMLEGITNPLDSRTIERSIASWDGYRKEYRHKKEKFRDSTTRV